MSEKTLIEKVQPAVGEEVLGVGVFRSLGSWLGGDVGGSLAVQASQISFHNPLLDAAAGVAGVAAGVAAGNKVGGSGGEGLAEYIAVTPTRIVAVKDTLGSMGEVTHDWQRNAVDVHVSNLVTKVLLTIVDHADGRQHQFEAGAIGASHASVVVHLLSAPA